MLEPLSPASVATASRAEATPKDPIPVDLRGTHAVIRATRSASKGLRAGADGRLHLGPRKGIVKMQISRGRLHRGLLLAHGIITAHSGGAGKSSRTEGPRTT